LDERLHVRDPSRERAQLIRPVTVSDRPRGLIRLGANAADLADPRDQSLTLAHAHR
jgi:hypothetical protein